MYHTYLTLIVPVALAFASTLIAIRFLMPLMLGSGITAIDYNKKSKPLLPSGLGTALSFGFSIGILAYIFGASFGLYPSTVPSQHALRRGGLPAVSYPWSASLTTYT